MYVCMYAEERNLMPILKISALVMIEVGVGGTDKKCTSTR